MSYLSLYPRVYQLKNLDMSGVIFFNLSHGLLGRLLERPTATLQKLQSKGCMIMGFQIDVPLPALNQCYQLHVISFLNNFLSMDSLNLLENTANLRQHTKGISRAHYEVYDEIGNVFPHRFAQHCSELKDMIKVIRKAKEMYFVSNNCVVCGGFCVYNFESSLCFCWQWERSLLDSEKWKPGLTGFIKDTVFVFQHFWMPFRRKQFFGSYLKELKRFGEWGLIFCLMPTVQT